MTIQLICDMCRQPKESVMHYSLVHHMPKAEDDSRHRRRQYAGSIDICTDCIERITHDGRDSAHKQHASKKRIEFGVVRR